VWYGSQTGTAENYAKQLATASKKHGFKARAVDLDKWKGADVAARGGFAIFVMATYGEGDPTDNAAEFHKWLSRTDHASGLLAGLRYTVFGLGNKRYEHYNKMGKARGGASLAAARCTSGRTCFSTCRCKIAAPAPLHVSAVCRW